MTEGLRYVRGDRPVLSLLILGLVPTVFIYPIQTLIPIFVKDVFHMGAEGYGVFLVANGAGSLLGTLGLASNAGMERRAPLLRALLITSTIVPMVFAWTRFFPLALFLMACQGAAMISYSSLSGALLQIRVPNAVLGRVMSINSLNAALIPLGGLFGALLAQQFGAPIALTIIGCCGLAFTVTAVLTLPALREL